MPMPDAMRMGLFRRAVKELNLACRVARKGVVIPRRIIAFRLIQSMPACELKFVCR